MRVWLVEDAPPCEPSILIGIYATKELAEDAEKKQYDHDYTVITEWYVHGTKHE